MESEMDRKGRLKDWQPRVVEAKGRKLFQYLVNYLKCFAWLSKMRTARILAVRRLKPFKWGRSQVAVGLGVSEETKESECRQLFEEVLLWRKERRRSSCLRRELLADSFC